MRKSLQGRNRSDSSSTSQKKLNSDLAHTEPRQSILKKTSIEKNGGDDDEKVS